jgi:hypothetical protein
MKRFVLLALLLAGCSRPRPEEHYGFVALLGRDTISVERVTRRGNTMTSDEVDRFPVVRQRHTEVTLNDDGSIRRLVMDIRTPSDSEKVRERHIEADVAKDSVRLTKRDGKSRITWNYATNGGTPVAHVDQMYSLYELRFQEARKRAAAQRPRGGGHGDAAPVLHRPRVRPLPDESRRDPAARRQQGGDLARLARRHRRGHVRLERSHADLLGARTTYLVEARRVADVPDIQTLATQFAAAEAKSGPRSLSVRDTVRASIGAAKFTVDYRPAARPRDARCSAASSRTTSSGAPARTPPRSSRRRRRSPSPAAAPAGGYTLWTVPRASGVELIVNKQTGQWGTSYDRSRDLGRAPMTVETLTTPVEQFTIAIAGKDCDARHAGDGVGPFRWTAPLCASDGGGLVV